MQMGRKAKFASSVSVHGGAIDGLEVWRESVDYALHCFYAISFLMPINVNHIHIIAMVEACVSIYR